MRSREYFLAFNAIKRDEKGTQIIDNGFFAIDKPIRNEPQLRELERHIAEGRGYYSVTLITPPPKFGASDL